MTKSNRNPGVAVAVPYKPTAADTTALAAYSARVKRRMPARVKVEQGPNGSAIRPDHPDGDYGTLALMQAFGTGSVPFMDGLLKQITNAASPGKQASEADINFALSVISGIEPRDEIEAMLGAQMAAVHSATMVFARRLAHVETIPQQDAAERAFNKLTRTFATQMEALKRYRSTGQQTVRVERVTVEAGGQAVVGAVNVPVGGGDRDES